MTSKPHAQHAHAHAHGTGHDHAHHEHEGHAHHEHEGHAHHEHEGHAHHEHEGHAHRSPVHVEGERPWAARTSDSKNAEFSAAEARQAKRLKWVLATVSAFFAVEFAGARVANSAVLEADALHLLMDVFALGMSLYAMRLAVRRPEGRFTFGLRRAEPLAALLNAGLILLASAEIVHEGIDHLRGAEEPKGSVMLVVAIGALVVNGISAWLLHGAMGHHGHDHDHDHGHGHPHGHAHAHGPKSKKKGEKGEKAASKKGHHLNLRGAWLHLMGDTLGSVAALVAALVVKLGGPAWADPVASFLVVVILVFGALRLIRDALVVLLEVAPKHLPLEEVREALLEVEGVERIDALHVWTLGGGQDAIMARVITRVPDSTAGARAAAHLRETFELDWVTVQADDPAASTK